MIKNIWFNHKLLSSLTALAAPEHPLHMKQLTLIILTLLTVLCGCHSRNSESKFQPQWLSDPTQVVYSSQYEGNTRVKLKAKVTESEFVEATKKLKMIPHAEDAEYAPNLEILRWRSGPDKQWDPSPAIDGTFICHRLNWWEIAKYENGFMYYQMLDLDK